MYIANVAEMALRTNPYLDQVREMLKEKAQWWSPYMQTSWKQKLSELDIEEMQEFPIDEMGMEKPGTESSDSCRLWIWLASRPTLQRVWKRSTCRTVKQGATGPQAVEWSTPGLLKKALFAPKWSAINDFIQLQGRKLWPKEAGKMAPRGKRVHRKRFVTFVMHFRFNVNLL